jgi:hypothetical protein
VLYDEHLLPKLERHADQRMALITEMLRGYVPCPSRSGLSGDGAYESGSTRET